MEGQPWLVPGVLRQENAYPVMTVCSPLASFPVSETSALLNEVCAAGARCHQQTQGTKPPSGQRSLPPALCPQGAHVPRALLGSRSETRGGLNATQTPSGLEMGEEEMG